ncbi:E-cinnamoyl-CoA:R-phenyllactate CoA transferase [Variibacter gotjawalensis]|uniref:E-cinnamoyl-CoA:R-phenyllactate CoA transferase n=1 Tax=Variibacter gotjawalensis TaxID=1333996 RepID=A0A0S3PZT9_9BRAD|nr:CoA transferase [Variibacter gotjawalensis]NIK47249.1 crotonobetainyl-CoA:carnitine CoA-transferase CaiB-like acyl-CoA transferase [Variibacter gotjawalensis]RZS49149.1 formyl-CoA transferase [Variibacter gotjawalensis]BAT61411.1 E-cinnamoyl-CoA:R-phenyllactate CoA transferase [Variibacter gotjawalensis]
MIFKGLKVLDCSSYIAAPAAATILSDFGADVIKVEPPGGDTFRYLSKMPGHPKSEQNYPWMIVSRNKRSLEIDLGKPEARLILEKLVKNADVFITNFPNAVRNKLGLTYDALAALNDKLIYASFTGYGDNGAEAAKPGFDVTAYWARSGLMDTVRASAQDVPVRPASGMGDYPSSFALFSGIVMALYQRQTTGKGSEVSSSLIANGLWAGSYFGQAALCGAEFFDRPARTEAFNALTNYYQCRDGKWLILTILNDDKQWPDFCRALEVDALIDDARFATRADRLKNARDLTHILDEAFGKQDRAYWRPRLNERRIVFDIVSVPTDIPKDQQLKDNNIVIKFADSDTLTITSPVEIRGVEKVTPRMPPSVGQHTNEILREAGFDDAAIASFRAAGALGKGE